MPDNDNKIPLQSNYNAGLGADMWAASNAGHHDAGFYEDFNRRRDEAAARGEDLYAEIAARNKERYENSRLGKLKKVFTGKGKKKQDDAAAEPAKEIEDEESDEEEEVVKQTEQAKK